MSRSRNEATTVEYATSDGTVRADEDYTGVSGTLTFGANDTSMTVSVTVLDDAHDEAARPGELDAGRPQGPLRADGRAARRAEPVRRGHF